MAEINNDKHEAMKEQDKRNREHAQNPEASLGNDLGPNSEKNPNIGERPEQAAHGKIDSINANPEQTGESARPEGVKMPSEEFQQKVEEQKHRQYSRLGKEEGHVEASPEGPKIDHPNEGSTKPDNKVS